MKRFKLFALLAALSLSVAAVEAQSGYTYEGCWSPYPNCAGAADVFRDSSGNLWECYGCGTNTTVTGNCFRAGNLYAIGYWCS